jgi:group I intron endonuclease
MFTNKQNGKKYVGSAVDLYKRLSFYFSTKALENSLKNNQSFIYNALLKDGYSNFSLDILEYCSIEELLKREKHFIDLVIPEYNIIQDPTLAPMSGREHSEESKTKISDTHKKIDHSGRFKTGHEHSDDIKQKISDAMVGKTNRKDTTQSDDTKKKISEAMPNSIKIEVTDNKNNQTITYDSIHEAAKALNINHTRIVKYFSRNQKKPYKGQYTFKKL